MNIVPSHLDEIVQLKGILESTDPNFVSDLPDLERMEEDFVTINTKVPSD
jgi:hypothetical protein